ncbi:FAD/NAD(P)-binding protein [Kineosporia succinea]|uniref:Uncharacterized protein n=1 Tax=Kineosporia succinea TaxID=84632 RepID=A0ABT9P7L8_9ACTN|nr:hypothetical protein [Kineosporia succinea]MDP9828693.1 hypothetical protein [Kineosporia succinea]
MTTTGTAHGDLTPHLVATSIWSDDLLLAAGLPLVDVPLVSVGGGPGSLALVDQLRRRAVPPHSLRVLSNLEVPWQTFEHLARVSQATVNDPMVDDVVTGLRRDHDRVGYPAMLTRGTVRMTRRRAGGGYFTVLTPGPGPSPRSGAPRRVVFRSRFVHLSLGHPGLRMQPDLVRYRADTGDQHRVVHSLEGHEHVYREVAARRCTVVVRGDGPDAARVLRRLAADRAARHTEVRIVHLAGPDRPGDDLPRGRKEGWYRAIRGDAQLVRARGTRLTLLLRPPTGGSPLEITGDFLVDCAGPDPDVSGHRVVADLLEHSGARRNSLNHLAVEPTGEVSGTRTYGGRLYAGGAATRSERTPDADTFDGLRRAARHIADDLAQQGFCARRTPFRLRRRRS